MEMSKRCAVSTVSSLICGRRSGFGFGAPSY
jgi:hypothetical protein